MRSLSLDCLTLPDVSPIDLCSIAASAGFSAVSLWVQPPALYPVMLADRATKTELRRYIADCGVTLGNLEVFNLNVDAPIADYEPMLAFGAELGASSATAINFGPERADIAERLAAFHNLCDQYGLQTYLEPISMGATRTLQDGVELICKAEVNARLVADCLHLMRTGGSAKTFAEIDPHYIGYVQVCDGPTQIADAEIGVEATANRLYPGEGEFPLMEILKAIPAHAVIGFEAPNVDRQKRGLSPLQRAREAFQKTTAILDKVRDVT